MTTWVLASGNAHKIAEFNGFFAASGLDLRLIPMKEAGFDGVVEENGLSFAENAYVKAKTVAEATGQTVLADDSGLCVDALGGAPGIRSARYAGTHGDDDANNEKLLGELENVPDGERTARYVCALCVVFPDGGSAVTEGTVEGRILREKKGSGRFGYDPLFWYEPLGRTFAELTPAEKETVSHRGEALRKMIPVFRERIEKQTDTESDKERRTQ